MSDKILEDVRGVSSSEKGKSEPDVSQIYEKYEDILITELQACAILDSAVQYIKTVRLNNGQRAEIHLRITKCPEDFIKDSNYMAVTGEIRGDDDGGR